MHWPAVSMSSKVQITAAGSSGLVSAGSGGHGVAQASGRGMGVGGVDGGVEVAQAVVRQAAIRARGFAQGIELAFQAGVTSLSGGLCML